MKIDLETGFSAEAVPRQAAFAVLPALLLAALVLGCASPGTRPGTSLFVRMGGMPAISTVVDETIDVVAAHPRARRSFEGIKLPAFKESVAAQFCVLAGGPCKYEGENMKKAHAGLKITDSEFDLMVSALRAVLDRHVGEAEKNEMLRLLAPMKRDVVGA